MGAAVSVLVLAGMAGGVLSAAGLRPHWPGWSGWGALALSGLALVLNLVTPSRPERRLWGPVTAAMLALALVAVAG